jgi:hypothetical protein
MEDDNNKSTMNRTYKKLCHIVAKLHVVVEPIRSCAVLARFFQPAHMNKSWLCQPESLQLEVNFYNSLIIHVHMFLLKVLHCAFKI